MFIGEATEKIYLCSKKEEENQMKTASIERAQLKGYHPVFTTESVLNHEPGVKEGKPEFVPVPAEAPDKDLLPLVKLLHSVYIQQAS